MARKLKYDMPGPDWRREPEEIARRGWADVFAPDLPLAGAPLDPRSEVFSVAACVYELLTGRRPDDESPPKKARSDAATLEQLLREDAAEEAKLAKAEAEAKTKRPAPT